MIYSITGKIIAKDINYAVLETAGIGFKISVLNDLSSGLHIGKRVKLLCILYPEQFELYGFAKAGERAFFEMLNSVSGIGPKIALKIMNSIDISSMKNAIVSEDLRMLKDGGISTKTASKIILELKDKIEKEGIKYGLNSNQNSDVKDALQSLGYNRKEIDEVLPHIPKSAKTAEERIKLALKMFAKLRRA